MLVSCPECHKSVSDKANLCPHCGYPLEFDSEKQTRRKKKTKKAPAKRMKLPNGFGGIVQIKGQNLRRPFRALITVGTDKNGRPIRKGLEPTSYFETYNEAYAALIKHQEKPFEAMKAVTMNEFFEKWIAHEEKEGRCARSIQSFRTTWRYCSSVYDLKLCDLHTYHIKDCMENGRISPDSDKPIPPTQTIRVKSNFAMMLDYAMELQLVDKNIARTVHIPNSVNDTISANYKKHRDFTQAQVEKIKEFAESDQCAQFTLVQFYSGWRPGELMELELANIDMQNWTFTGGKKTESGTNRIVPIHPAIREYVQKAYHTAEKKGTKYLFFFENKTQGRHVERPNYTTFHRRFNEMLEFLNIDRDHRPHDGRVHFVTMAKKHKVDEYAIKRIIGHHISDLTQRVYTDRGKDVAWLHEEISKIP